MKISVVTVCRNSAQTIAFTIESWCRQTHPDKELLIIDGASTDATLSIVRSFAADGIRVISEPDQGLYDAMNKGLALFSGDAIGFLNSDDRFKDEDSLATIAVALAKSDIAHGNLNFVSDHQTARVLRQWRGSPHRRGAFTRGWMPAHPTFYVRRSVVDAVGSFDLQYPISADYDYMLRALELHEFPSTFVDAVLVEMMSGGKSTAGIEAYVKSNIESLRSRRRWLGAGLVDVAFFAKPLRKLPQFRKESLLR